MKRLLSVLLVSAYCLLPAAYCVLPTACSAAQCPGGTCPFTLTPSPRHPVTPSSSYRFVEPAGHYRAVVRVRGESGVLAVGRVSNPSHVSGGQAHKIGSGVAVHWDEKTVVLTAAHVARGCKRVSVYLAKPKRWAAAASVKLDDRWDVAILTLAHADTAELEPADIAWGEDATPKQGARLESCGLGPDGRLAVNAGVLLGYRSNGPDRSADWIDISGPARQGDSGGPVFDAKGQVVGILWGTDDRTVTATQGGYLHKLLAESLGPWQAEAPAVQVAALPNPETAAQTPCCPAGTPSEACVGKLFPKLLGQKKAPRRLLRR